MEYYDQDKYERARKRVQEIKGFYSHLTVYIVVNALLILLRMGIFQNGFADIKLPTWSMFTTPFFWGIGLAAHGIWTFHRKLGFLKNWEERKIKEYMERDEVDYKKRNKKDR